MKQEEQRVIEEANKRMADVHSRKAQEANKAAQAIEAAKENSRKKQEAAKAAEAADIAKAVSTSATNTVK